MLSRRLGWALGATFLMSVWALWSSPPQLVLVDAVTRTLGRSPAEFVRSPASVVATATTTATAAAVGDRIPNAPPRIEPAQRDIFAPFAVPQPPTLPVREVAPISAPAEAPVPVAPLVSYRFVGRMVAPDGHPVTLLENEHGPVEAEPGKLLDQGYVVKSVSAETVQLAYPPLSLTVEIPIPPPSESRR